ncbi:MAG TPA: DUF2809 domain-containing protein [Paludibacter sp.]
MKRNRLIYLGTVIATITLGLLSRRFSHYLPEIINSYLGDALWALMIFQFVAMVFPTRKTFQIAFFSLIFCYLIEISQLYHAPWIDAVRNTRLGGLVLGFGFLWTDIIAYSFGIGFGTLVEKIVFKTE